MMLHVPLTTLQGSTKLHFSFQITKLSAREGDQIAEKEIKEIADPIVRAHPRAWQESCPPKL